MASKKLLLLINRPEIGGSQRIFAELMEILPQEGCPVQLAYLFGAPSAESPARDDVAYLGFRNIADIRALLRFRAFVRTNGITHILATLEQASIAARLVGWLAWDLRIVVSEPGMADRKPLFAKLLDIALNVRTDAIVAGSTKVRESLLSYQPFYARKIPVLLNGTVVPVPPLPHTPEPAYTILAVGRLIWEKGFDRLIEAFGIFLQETGADAQLVIVGGGPLADSLKAQASEASLSSKIRFLGELDFKETKAWFLRAHCFAISSLSEGAPLVVLEAMANGLPVVSTRVGQVPETIEDGVSGIIVAPGSAAELAAGLVRLYVDEPLRARMARAGYERVRDHFSFDEHVRALRKILGL